MSEHLGEWIWVEKQGSKETVPAPSTGHSPSWESTQLRVPARGEVKRASGEVRRRLQEVTSCDEFLGTSCCLCRKRRASGPPESSRLTEMRAVPGHGHLGQIHSESVTWAIVSVIAR